MINLKEAYNQIDSWYKSNDENKIQILLNNWFYHDNSEKGRFQKTIIWYKRVNELSKNKVLILGDKILSIEDIKNYVLENIIVPQEKKFEEQLKIAIKEDHHYDEDDYNGLYDTAGYGTANLVAKIRWFWENLDGKALYSVSEETEQDKYDVDLSGGRLYLKKDIIDVYAFNYVYYSFKNELSEKKFKEWCIYQEYALEEILLPDSHKK